MLLILVHLLQSGNSDTSLLWTWIQLHSKIPKVLMNDWRPGLLRVLISLDISECNKEKKIPKQLELLPEREVRDSSVETSLSCVH